MIKIYENNIRLPKIPSKEHSHKYDYTSIDLSDSYADDSRFNILKNKKSAYGFINYMLWCYDFPMAAYEHTLRQYREDPEDYKELMMRWEDTNNISSDDNLCYYAWGNYHFLDYESTLQNTYNIFRFAHGVQSLIFEDGYEITILNGYIYKDYDYNSDNEFIWRADIDLPKEIEFDKYHWRNVHGTMIQGDEIVD